MKKSSFVVAIDTKLKHITVSAVYFISILLKIFKRTLIFN